MAIPVNTTAGGPTVQVGNAHPTEQFIRACTLLVSNSGGQALDLSALRIKFTIKRSMSQTPNAADIRVYNLDAQTAIKIQNEFTRVILQAGYPGNLGVIFSGNIKQTIIGRESATDTFIEFIAGDGDRAYNFAVTAATIGAGATQQDIINATANSMTPLGGTQGGNSSVPATPALPRGRVVFGCNRDILRDVAQTTQSSWSIQNEQVVFIPNYGYLPGQAVIVNYESGMIGTPQQTLDGVNTKVLLNPKITIGTRIQLNNNSIARLPINLSQPGTAASIPAPLTTDGVYFVAVAEHTGDTRGVEWYTNLVTIYIDPIVSPQNAVAVSYD